MIIKLVFFVVHFIGVKKIYWSLEIFLNEFGYTINEVYGGQNMLRELEKRVEIEEEEEHDDYFELGQIAETEEEVDDFGDDYDEEERDVDYMQDDNSSEDEDEEIIDDESDEEE